MHADEMLLRIIDTISNISWDISEFWFFRIQHPETNREFGSIIYVIKNKIIFSLRRESKDS